MDDHPTVPTLDAIPRSFNSISVSVLIAPYDIRAQSSASIMSRHSSISDACLIKIQLMQQGGVGGLANTQFSCQHLSQPFTRH